MSIDFRNKRTTKFPKLKIEVLSTILESALFYRDGMLLPRNSFSIRPGNEKGKN